MRLALVFVTTLLLGGGTPSHAQDGKAAYDAQCAKCHGDAGQADTVVGKAMKTPALAGKTYSADQVSAAVRSDPKHASIKDDLSDVDLTTIAGYLATLGGE